jgi:hypothetical protein
MKRSLEESRTPRRESPIQGQDQTEESPDCQASAQGTRVQGTGTRHINKKKQEKSCQKIRCQDGKLRIEDWLPRPNINSQAPSSLNSLYKGPLPPVLASSDSSDPGQPSKTSLKQDPLSVASLPSQIDQNTSTNRSKPLPYPITLSCIFVHPLIHQSEILFPI